MFAENATLYIDGKKTVLNIGKADRDVYETYKVKVSEDFFFPITKTLLKQITQGKEVALRITGKKGMIDAYFSSQNLYNLKKFYDEELK